MHEEHKRQLDEVGYVVLSGLMGDELLHALRTRIHELFVEEGERAGSEFRTEAHAHRLANLVDKGEVFRRAVAHPAVIDGVRHVIGQPKLSSLNARSADPHSDAGQPLHVDMAAVPDERGYWVCNTIWMLDDFTPDNGATRVVAGSHKWGTRPQEVLADPEAPHPGEVLVTGKGGRRGDHEFAFVARRDRQPYCGAAAGDARLLLPPRQAAAAVSEEAAAPRGAGRAVAGACASCSRSTIRSTTS